MVEIWAVSLVIIGTFIGAFGSLYLKKSSDGFKFNIISIIKNRQLIFALLLYGISAILYIIALSGGELSIIYPFVSLGYVWATLLSAYSLKEKITNKKIISVAVIVMGVALVGLGG